MSLRAARALALVLFGCLASLAAGATSVSARSLEEMLQDSDHVLVATVTQVDMVDAQGRQVSDPEARTGPASRNQIRFHLDVKHTLFTTARPPAQKVVVPLWQAWIYSLGQIRQAVEGNTSIFLLKGDHFEPAYPRDFERPVAQREEIEALLRALRKKPAAP